MTTIQKRLNKALIALEVTLLCALLGGLGLLLDGDRDLEAERASALSLSDAIADARSEHQQTKALVAVKGQ